MSKTYSEQIFIHSNSSLFSFTFYHMDKSLWAGVKLESHRSEHGLGYSLACAQSTWQSTPWMGRACSHNTQNLWFMSPLPALVPLQKWLGGFTLQDMWNLWLTWAWITLEQSDCTMLWSSVQCPPIGMHRPEPEEIPDFTLLPKPGSQDASQGLFQMPHFTNPTQDTSSVKPKRSRRCK